MVSRGLTAPGGLSPPRSQPKEEATGVERAIVTHTGQSSFSGRLLLVSRLYFFFCIFFAFATVEELKEAAPPQIASRSAASCRGRYIYMYI